MKLAALFAFLMAFSAHADPSLVEPKGELRGKVTIVPNCKVKEAGAICAATPRQISEAILQIKTLDGKSVGLISMQNDGHFSKLLPPGTYEIKTLGAFPTQPVYGPARVIGLPAKVTIQAAKPTELNFRLEDWDVQ